MAKTIKIPYGGKDYTLEFTRSTVRAMERAEFDIQELGVKPVTRIPQLFAGAFMANHSSVKNDKIEEIYDALGDKTKLIENLVSMYIEPVNALTDEGDEEKNVKWEASW